MFVGDRMTASTSLAGAAAVGGTLNLNPINQCNSTESKKCLGLVYMQSKYTSDTEYIIKHVHIHQKIQRHSAESNKN